MDAAAASTPLAALSEQESTQLTAQLARSAYPLPTPAFVGMSVSLEAPGLFVTENLKVEGRAGTNSGVAAEHMEAGRRKLAEWLNSADSLTLGLPRLDVPAGSCVEWVCSSKWESLLVHAVTPEDWAGNRVATWGDLKLLAAYGVPLVGEVEQGGAGAGAAAVVSGAAAEVPAVSEAAPASGAAAASACMPAPRSGAVVAAVNAARKVGLRQVGLRRLLGAVKLTLPLAVAAIGCADLV